MYSYKDKCHSFISQNRWKSGLSKIPISFHWPIIFYKFPIKSPFVSPLLLVKSPLPRDFRGRTCWPRGNRLRQFPPRTDRSRSCPNSSSAMCVPCHWEYLTEVCFSDINIFHGYWDFKRYLYDKMISMRWYQYLWYNTGIFLINSDIYEVIDVIAIWIYNGYNSVTWDIDKVHYWDT